MSIGGAPSAAGLAFENFTVQRDVGVHPPRLRGLLEPDLGDGLARLDPACSASVSRWRVDAVDVASTIRPAIGGYPASLIAASTCSNDAPSALAPMSASRKSQSVSASDTASRGSGPHQRIRRGARKHRTI